MNGARRKEPLKRKAVAFPEGVLPQLEYSNEKPEWHRSILQIKGSTNLIKRTPAVPVEKKVKTKRKGVKRMGYWAMLDERQKFRSSLLRAFRPFEEKKDTSGLLSKGLTAEERQWLRYEYYLRKLIPTETVAPLTKKNERKILSRVPEKLKVGMEAELEKTMQLIKEEYIWIVKKSAVDSLMFSSTPKKSAYNPSSVYYKEMSSFAKMSVLQMKRQKKKLSESYILSNKCILRLLEVWLETGAKLSFINLDLLKKDEPYEVTTYLQVVKMQILNAQDKLHKQWYPHVQRTMAIGIKKNLIPQHRKNTFFNCVASIMISQLKSLCLESLHKYENYVCHFKEEIGTLKIKLVCFDSNYKLQPDIREIEKALIDPFDLMQWAVSYFSRVESSLEENFDDAAKDYLRTNLPENIVFSLKEKVSEFLHSEWNLPSLFMNELEKYKFLFTDEAETELNDFLQNEHVLEDFRNKVDYFMELKQEINYHRGKYVKQGIFTIDCIEFFENLFSSITNLLDKLFRYLEETLATSTSSLIEEYEIVIQQLKSLPSNTKELFEAKEWLQKFKEHSLNDLKAKLQSFTSWIYFMCGLVDFTAGQFGNHAKIFAMHMGLPKIIQENVLAAEKALLTFQEDLIERRQVFTEDLKARAKQITNLSHLGDTKLVEEYLTHATEIQNWLTDAQYTVELFNSEEILFEWEITNYPLCITLANDLKPYVQLYEYAVDFGRKRREWLEGTIHQVDPEVVEQEVMTLWRLLYKLEKTFSDSPEPRKIAENVRNTVEKFKDYIPLVQTLCNPGLRDRHWDQISEIVGFPLKPDKSTTLAKLIGLNLQEYIPQFEVISEAASKEFKLEKALDKMMEEWSEMMFSVKPFRESGTYILSSVDEIQLLLDDHLIKTQTMRGSPSVKPIEGRVKSWESKLMLLQEIIDEWLKVQATWLYLEPIFSSPDIMAQMPEEGRRFNTVDKNWREVMKSVLEDRHVLVVVDIENMLDTLKTSNELLDLIQKSATTFEEMF
ncbi:dynein heavy chain 7, axonemal [Trichonephila inaurata madagascariensis]|uniref:Dynein heavy chain 7, axonemal n=1 Tax=Trichonephila inaurata madagascariensis TaxID=2747483 RepID=A0A8X6J7M4_9ARAC|nr:dynein heavy chain 7, axonemal [Trichonephila inaurata madagascariensis]